MVQQPAVSQEVAYQSEEAWPDSIDHALVLHCSDPWYREATAEFLEDYLGLYHCDSLVVPGGPAVVLQSSLTFTADRAKLKMLQEHHEVARFVGIAHLDCAYYKLRYPSASDGERMARQLADLREFERYVRSLVREAEIQLFFAERAEGRVRFLVVR